MKREFVATVYVVKDDKVLLVFHKKLQKWLPPGGHIHEGELPDETAVREVKEETGLDVELIGEKQPKLSDIVDPLFRPEVVQLEYIADDETHHHIDLFYLAVPTVKSGDIKMHEGELDDIRWFSLEDLDKENIPENIRYTAKLMIKKIRKL